MPYYIGDVIKDERKLIARTPEKFEASGIHVLLNRKVEEVDGEKREVRLENGERLPFDVLVLATGAAATRPPIPGLDLPGVYSLKSLPEAVAIKKAIGEGGAKKAAIIGAGFIAMETAEAFRSAGVDTTLIQRAELPVRRWDPEYSAMVKEELQKHGVHCMPLTSPRAVERGASGGLKVVTDRGEVEADLVLVATGVKPNTLLAGQLGVAVGKTGAISVNFAQETSREGVYAVGDCCESFHRVSRSWTSLPLGDVANKQGRVAANHICGVEDEFPGVLGSAVCKVFDYCVARTGLTEREARAAGFDAEVTLTPAPDKAHFMPEARMLMLKLVADRKTRKLLGAQAVGPGAGDKRVDVAAMALTAGMTVDQLAHADLCYAPPYSPAVDNILTAADVMRNKFDNIFKGVSAEALQAELSSDATPVLLDVRTQAEFDQMRLPGSLFIPLGSLRARLKEVPRDRPVVCFCKISLRGYEAARILQGAGYENVRVLDGGLITWPYGLESGD